MKTIEDKPTIIISDKIQLNKGIYELKLIGIYGESENFVQIKVELYGNYGPPYFM